MTTDTLTPTTAHTQLDTHGWLDAAQKPGVYCLELEPPPETHDAVAERWHAVFETAPEGLYARLADAAKLCYVGAAGTSVYDRIEDHAAGEKRKAAVLEVFPPVGVLGVEACGEPFEREYGYALEWTGGGCVCWVNGEVLG